MGTPRHVRATPVATLVALGIAGCAGVPPEREERDQIVLKAIEPCKQQYSHYFARDALRIDRDGRVRYFYWDHLVSRVEEANRCIDDAVKPLKLGPWAPAKVVRGGPSTVSTSAAGKELVVRVRMNGVPGAMALRTNWNLTYATPAYAKRAGLSITAESPTTRVRISDQPYELPYARVRELKIGEASVEAIDIAVHDVLPEQPTVDGVIGASFLSHFKTSVDRRAGRVILELVK